MMKEKIRLMLIWIVVLCGIALELYVIYSTYEIPVLSYFFPSSNKIPRREPLAPDDYCGPYSKDLNLFIRVDYVEGNLWRAYINTTNPGTDSDYIEFKYPPHEGQPAIGLCFPDSNPNMIYVTDFADHVTAISSNHFQIRRMGDIDNYIGPRINEDSLYFASQCQTIMLGAYIPQVMLNDDMTGWKEYLHRIE